MPSHSQFKKSLLCSALLLICSTGFSLSQTTTPLVELEEEELINTKPTIDLSKIVVTAGGFAQEVKDAPASISVVSKQEIQEAPFRDVTDALRDIPGVNVSGRGNSADISIRGMDPKYTLFMVDGKRQNSRESRPNGSEGFEQGWIPPLSVIERIEVVRGPMSSRYGSDAMGGVVNVITKKVSDKWGGSVRLESNIEGESHTGNTQTAELYLNGPIISEKLGLQLYGKYSHRSEGKYYQSKTGSNINGSAEDKMHNLGGKLTFVPVEGHTVELEAGTAVQRTIANIGKSLEKGLDADDTHRRDNQSIRYLGEHDYGITSDFMITHEKTDNKFRNINFKNLEASGNVIIPIGMHTITVGGQLRKETLNGDDNKVIDAPTKLTHKSQALFIEDEWWLLDNVSLTGGLRYDHDEDYGSNFTPRVYAVWNANDAITIKGGVSSGYSAPSLRETSPVWGQQTGGRGNQGDPYARGLIIGNPDLKPEKTLNYEIGMSFAPSDELDTSITAFYTKFKDKIQIVDLHSKTPGVSYPGPDGRGYGFIQTRINADQATSKGVELSVKWKPIEVLTLTGNYTWIDTEITKGQYKGEQFTQTPKHMLNIHADWQINAQANVWTKLNYRGEETSLTRSGGPGDKYPGYTTFDLGGSYKVNRDTSIYAGVYNVTNKKIEDPKLNHTIDGRRYWIGINVDF